ncbi:MAG: UPF0158 family protein [Sedimentisphaerales bacterium]
MATRVRLADIIEGIESQSDENTSFLNAVTGEVVVISDYEMRAAEESDPIEDFPEWEQDQVSIAREIIAETGDYIPLPTQFDIHEYGMIERFCLSVNDPKLSDLFSGLIRGNGAFRRFKDAVRKHGLEDDWHAYHNEALKEIAIDWCRENDIDWDE